MYDMHAFNRLKTLTEYEGFTVTDGSVIKGELAGYLTGMWLVQEKMDMCLQESFAQFAENQGLSYALYELNLSMEEDLEHTHAAICARLSQPYGAFSTALFEEALHTACGASASYKVKNGVLTLLHISGEADGMQAAGKFIREWAAPFLTVAFGGSGRTWDALDSLGCTFAQFDRMDCPFSILDTAEE